MGLAVAILGAGIGAEHLQGYRQLEDDFQVKAICDINAQRAGLLAADSDIAIFSDYQEILSDPQIDIVDICLPPHLHFSAISEVLHAGKDVICEKPLLASCAECDQIEALSLQTGKQVFPVFQYRFGKGASQLHALMKCGLAGKAYTATLETHWNRDAAYYDNDWRGTWAGEQGGAILGHAIHIHDWVCHILGPVSQVFALLDTRVNDIEVEDCAALSLRMQNGALVTSSVTLGSADDFSRLRFCFEGFTAESDILPYTPAQGVWRFTARAPYHQQDIDARLAEIQYQDYAGYAGLFHEIAKALRGESHQAVLLSDARNSLELVTAIYQSARTLQAVSLPLTPQDKGYDSWLP